MKAILSIPAKFLAVFSNRVRMRRLSFSQPISRSMTFRCRYFLLLNVTGRASRSSFSFEGITGMISSSIKQSSIQSARYALSPARATGHAIGSPSVSRTSASVPLSKGTKAVDSWSWPGVR